MMFIDFNEFTKNTQGVVKAVCSFVGADPALYKHKELPPGMKVSAKLQPCMGLSHLLCPTQPLNRLHRQSSVVSVLYCA